MAPRRFRFTRPSRWPVRSGSGHPDTFTVAVRETGAGSRGEEGQGCTVSGKQWGGVRGYSPRPPHPLSVSVSPFLPLPASLDGLFPGQIKVAGLVTTQVGKHNFFQVKGSERLQKPPDRKTGKWGPANPACPSSFWIDSSVKVTPRGYSAPARPAGASPHLLCGNPKSLFFGGRQAGRWGATTFGDTSHAASRSCGRDANRGGGRHSGGTFTGARRFQASPQPARAHSPHPPAPNPIRAWHRLSNRLTNAAPPIAGRPGRGLSYQASLRGPSFKSLKLFQLRACPRFAGIAGHLVG